MPVCTRIIEEPIYAVPIAMLNLQPSREESMSQWSIAAVTYSINIFSFVHL